MSPQADYVVSNGTGAAVRSDINGQLAAIVSNNSGATEPATMYAYQWWPDTTTGLLKIRNSANNAWVTVGTLASVNLGLAALASPTFTGTVTAPTFTASTAVNIPLGSAGSPTLFFTGDSNTGLFSPAADTIAFAEGGVESMRIDSSGRLGIGTTGPQEVLDVNGRGRFQGSASSAVSGAGLELAYVSASTKGQILSYNRGTSTYLETNIIGNPLTFNISGSEAARIDTSSRLLVGTSTARDNFFGSASGQAMQFQVEGTDYKNSGASFTSNNSATAGFGPHVLFARSRGASVGSNTIVQNGDNLGIISYLGNDGAKFIDAARIACEVDGTPGTNDMPGRLVFSTTADGASSPTERMRITSGGLLYCQGVYDYATASSSNVNVFSNGHLTRNTSSLKYKTNIETLEDSYADAILQCRPVWYKSLCQADNPDHSFWGFIAEEVVQIDPRLIHWKTEESIVQDDGSRTTIQLENPEPDGVQYDRFVPHLLNLIKRQKEQIEAMEERLSALEAQ